MINYKLKTAEWSGSKINTSHNMVASSGKLI